MATATVGPGQIGCPGAHPWSACSTGVELRQAALNLTGLAGGVVVVTLGFGALVGFSGAFVARDVARRTVATK